MKSVILLAFLFGCSLAANYTVYCGFDIDGWNSLNFYPSALVVNKGDSVTFVPLTQNLVITFSPEVVPLFAFTKQNGDWVFLPTTYQPTGGNSVESMARIYSSGFLGVETNWTAYFPNDGIYTFYNPFGLPFMRGVVYVVDSMISTIPATTIDGLTRIALSTMAKSVFPQLAVTKGTMDTIPSGRRLPDGTYEWSVRLIGDIWTASTYARYTPSNFTVGVGDSIIFINDDIIPHTVSFNSSGQWMPDIFNDSTGHLVFNGIFAESHSSSALNYTGGFANSGFLLPLYIRSNMQNVNMSTFPAGMTFNNTFTFGGSNAVLDSIVKGNYSFGMGPGAGASSSASGNINVGAGGSITNNNNNFGSTITNNNNLGSATASNNSFFGNSNTTSTPVIHFWKITFGAAGTYPYRCDLNYEEGMVGQIVVVPHRNATSATK